MDRGDLIEALCASDPIDLGSLLEDKIPRGSSLEEMLPEARRYHARVREVVTVVLKFVRPEDTSKLTLEDLRGRGLRIADDTEDLYDGVVRELRQHLASPPRRMFDIPDMSYALGPIRPAWVQEADLRRLDESIRDEQQAHALHNAAAKDVDRLTTDLEQFAQPVGVTSAVVILGVFSILGILLPLAVMLLDISRPPVWLAVGLLAAFALGLAAVLGYIIWYLRRVRQ